jgi:hypothetical protein
MDNFKNIKFGFVSCSHGLEKLNGIMGRVILTVDY